MILALYLHVCEEVWLQVTFCFVFNPCGFLWMQSKLIGKTGVSRGRMLGCRCVNKVVKNTTPLLASCVLLFIDFV